MKNLNLIASLGAVLAFAVSPAFSSAGTSGASVLSIPVGARAVSMGEAYTAQADDVSSLYWNPAGLAILNQSQASFMYSQWLKDLTYHNAGVALPFENGGIGASLSYLSYGQIDGFDALGNPTGDVSAYSGVATVGGAWLGDIWSLGMNLKGVQGKLADVTATGFAADFGASVVYPNEVLGGTMRGAFTLRNVGTGLKYIDQKDPFPREWRFGLAAVQMANRKLNLSVDYGMERDQDGAIYAGGEYWALPFIALRTGWAGTKDESSGLRAGVGIKVKDLTFDYAYGSFGDLGMAHRYEMSFRFGAIQPRLTPEERRMLRRAKLAMARGENGEAVQLLDSLITMEPRYTLFRRLVKTAMNNLEKQEDQAKAAHNFQFTERMKQSKPVAEDPTELQELQQLLQMSEDGYAKASEGAAKPAGEKKQ